MMRNDATALSLAGAWGSGSTRSAAGSRNAGSAASCRMRSPFPVRPTTPATDARTMPGK